MHSGSHPLFKANEGCLLSSRIPNSLVTARFHGRGIFAQLFIARAACSGLHTHALVQIPETATVPLRGCFQVLFTIASPPPLAAARTVMAFEDSHQFLIAHWHLLPDSHTISSKVPRDSLKLDLEVFSQMLLLCWFFFVFIFEVGPAPLNFLWAIVGHNCFKNKK